MVNKSIVTISVDPNVWEAVKNLYPRKISGLIENFLRDLLSSDVNLAEFDTKTDLIKEITHKNVDINTKKSELTLLKNKLEEVNKKEQKTLEINEVKDRELRNDFVARNIADDFHFKATLEMAKKKDLIPKDIELHLFYFNYYINEDFVSDVMKPEAKK